MDHVDENNFHINYAEAEGQITKLWSRSNGDILFRLAVYDEHAESLRQEDSVGREKRKPHFITVVVLAGRVNGRPVNIQKGDHIRVTGFIRDESYFETLYDFLVKAKAEYLLGYLPADAKPIQIRSGRVATQLVCQTFVQFTN